jgi:hypothetical protein
MHNVHTFLYDDATSVIWAVQKPYHPYLSSQFSDAFNVYLEICRHVKRKITMALGHNDPNCRLFNSCPPCFYKLEGEPQLEFSCFVSFDGNDSLKQLGEKV